MAEEDKQNAPNGQVRTMANDLAKARGEKPEDSEEESPVGLSTQEDQTQKPQNEDIVGSLDEILPLEEDGATDNAQPPAPKPPAAPNQEPSVPDNLPTGEGGSLPSAPSQDNAQPPKPPAAPKPPSSPEPPKPPAPTQGGSQTQGDGSKLESEIFPDPSLDEPKKKEDAPMSLSDEEAPSETPEELLGLSNDKKTPQPPSAPPKEQQEKDQAPSGEGSPQQGQKEYKPLSPEPESFKLSMGKPEGPLYWDKDKNKKEGGAPSSKNTNKMLVLGSLIVLAAVLAGGAVYFFFFGGRELLFNTEPEQEQTETPPPPSPAPQPAPPPPAQVETPAPLVTPDFEQEGLVAANTQQNSIESVFQRVKDEFTAPSETITYLPIQLGSVPEGGEAEFMNLQQFLEGVGIATPGGFYEAVEPDLMLYAYTSGDEERIMCQNNLISQADCYGVRLGFVVKAQEGREADLAQLATQWENQVASSNFASLILSELATIPEDVTFTGDEYQSAAVANAPVINVRYANLPMPSYNNLSLSTTALDIAVVGDMMIVSTSKRSMHAMIDKTLQQQQ